MTHVSVPSIPTQLYSRLDSQLLLLYEYTRCMMRTYNSSSHFTILLLRITITRLLCFVFQFPPEKASRLFLEISPRGSEHSFLFYGYMLSSSRAPGYMHYICVRPPIRTFFILPYPAMDELVMPTSLGKMRTMLFPPTTTSITTTGRGRRLICCLP